jgi:hypothetical protein
MRPHRGVLVLVFGILGLVCCVIFGIIAWVMGSSDLREIDAGRMDPAGRGLTQAGKICGIISVVLLIVTTVLGILFAILGALSGARSV